MHSSATKPLRLRELSLKCPGSYVFGTHIVTAAVHALAKPNAQLRMLDVTGNACGDALAQALGEMLPKNKSLQALYWDGNCITVDGFHQFYDGLLQNQTLIMVEMPIQDTRRVRVMAMLWGISRTILTDPRVIRRSWRSSRIHRARSSSVSWARSSKLRRGTKS